MRYEWSAVFTKDEKRVTHHLNFTAIDVETAYNIIKEYVEGVTSEGWILVENEVKIS